MKESEGSLLKGDFYFYYSSESRLRIWNFKCKKKSSRTPFLSFASFLHDPAFTSGKTAAIIPRGFGFEWDTEDHHLLQIGYNLDHSEKFIEKDKKYYKKDGTETPQLVNSASYSDSGFVSWETYSIYKDNATRRNYHFGEIVSGLAGSDF